MLLRQAALDVCKGRKVSDIQIDDLVKAAEYLLQNRVRRIDANTTAMRVKNHYLKMVSIGRKLERLEK